MKRNLSIKSILLTLSATFILPSALSAAFIVPPFFGGPDDYIGAEWDVFTHAVDTSGTNSPDVQLASGGFAPGPLATDITLSNSEPSAFLTGGGNIYSFAQPTFITVENNFNGLTASNVLFQFKTIGTEADYSSILLNVQTTGGSLALAPTLTQELSRSSAGGGFGGTEVEFAAQWDLTSISLVSDEFSITFNASGSSMSLDQARLDFTGNGSGFNQVIPEPTTGALLMSGLLFTVLRRRKMSS